MISTVSPRALFWMMISLTVAIVIGIVVSIPVVQQSIMCIRCCNGTPCSDTYYTPEDNKCHLTLCEHSLFTDKSKCTYNGGNKTVEAIS